MDNSQICSIPDCGKPVKTRGWCNPHYKRFLRHGDPLAGQLAKGMSPAFLKDALASETDDCIIWPYGKTRAGYGVIMLNNRTTYVHSLACAERNGPRPEGRYEAAHDCGNPSCCNPRHLRWATASENQLDKRKHGTHNHGMQNVHCKLSDDDVMHIRAMSVGMTNAAIARQFGVSSSRIWHIVNGQARQLPTGQFANHS